MDCFTNRILFFVLLFSLMTACQDEEMKDHGDVLAKIENLEVTENHFLAAFKKYYYKTGQALKPSLEIKSSILNSEFNTYVLATYAIDEGLDKSKDAWQELDMITRRVSNEEYREQVILKDVKVTDQELHDLFVRLNTTLRASHLYAYSKKEADSLYERVLKGESFEKLAKEVFNNSKLANHAGDLGEFGVDEMDVAFEKSAYSLKLGEISKPVRTVQGYSIIKLTDRFQKPIITEAEFANKKNQIRYLAKKQEEELASRNHLYQFIDNIDFDQDKIELIWQKISNNYSLFIADEVELFSGLFSPQTILLTSNEFQLTYSDFINELRLTPVSALNNVKQQGGFKNLLKGIAYRIYLYRAAKAAGIPDQKRVRASINQSYYTYLAQLTEDKIRTEIQISDKEIRDTFEHEPEKFVKPLEVNFSRIVQKEKATADLVYKKLKEGASFSSLIDKYTLKNEEKLRSGELGYDYIGSFGLFGEKLSDLKVGEFSTPLLYQTGEYHIFKCLGRIEERRLSFEEAKELVRQYVIDKKFKKVRNNTIETVKEKHDAIVNLERLKQLRIEI